MKRTVLLAMLLVAVLACAPVRARGAPGGSTSTNVVLLPDVVNRYETYIVSVVAPGNTLFNLTAYGSNGFQLAWRNYTGPNGVWQVQLSAWYDYGVYSFHLSTANNTSIADLTVGCNARCQSDILRQNGVDQQALIFALLTQYGLYAMLIVLALEIPKAVHYFSKAARDAKKHGQYTAKDSLASFFTRLRGHINPGDQVTDPQDIQNPRIAVDLERREYMEQLRDALSRRFMSWTPDGIEPLRELFHDLESAWTRQAAIQPVGEPYAHVYLPQKVVRTPAPNPTPAAAQPAPPVSVKERTKKPVRWLHVAVYAVGALAGLMVLLIALAYIGVYVDPLRALWAPWPSDAVKAILGSVAVVVALGAAWYWRIVGQW